VSRIRFVICLSLVAILSQQACAAPGDLLFKITAPDPQPGAWFGNVISVVDGDMLVSEPLRRLGLGIDTRGRAYLFDGKTGALKTTFDNPEPARNDVFGQAAVGGDGRVFIRTNGAEPRIYGFDAKSGEVLYTIRDPDGEELDVGVNLAYGSGSLLTAAPAYSGVPFVAQSIGRGYLFDAKSGHFERAVPNPEPKAGDVFGIGVSPLAVFGNRVVIGAQDDDLPGDNHPDGDNPGRVWVIDRLTGETILTLENPNAAKGPPHFFSDWFASTVAANQHVIAVGAMNDDTSGIDDAGTVYIYDTKTGALRHTLFSPRLEADGEFGQSLAVTPEGNVLVGAWAHDVNGVENVGRAYLFDGLTGNLLLDIPNPDPTRNAAFGWRVAAMDNRLIVGDFASTEGIYVFESIPEPSSVVLMASLLLVSAALHQVRRLRKSAICGRNIRSRRPQWTLDARRRRLQLVR
jgi:outer membrane protein assembly factor BamB